MGTKTFPYKLVMKRSVLKPSLPNSQHKVLYRSWYEGYIETTKIFVVMCTILAQGWGQKKNSHADYSETADDAGIGEWVQLDLQSIQHRD